MPTGIINRTNITLSDTAVDGAERTVSPFDIGIPGYTLSYDDDEELFGQPVVTCMRDLSRDRLNVFEAHGPYGLVYHEVQLSLRAVQAALSI